MFTRKPADTASQPPAVAPPVTAEPAAGPGRRFTDTLPSCDSAIAAGLRLRGTVSGTGSIRVEGEFEGRIEIDGLCHIARGGRVLGPITASDAIVEGEFEGRLAVKGRIELSATATVRGDIDAPTVAVAEGCFFDGHMNMPGGDVKSQPVTFREKRRKRSAPAQPKTPETEPAPEPSVAAPEAAAASTATPPEPATQTRPTS